VGCGLWLVVGGGGGREFWGLLLGPQAAEEVGAGVVVGDEVLEPEDQAVGVTGVAELAEEFETGGEVSSGSWEAALRSLVRRRVSTSS